MIGRILERLFPAFRPPEPASKDIPIDEDLREIAWMIPPTDMHDASAWDVYWRNQAEQGLLGIQLFDALSNSKDVAAAMSANGLRSVLCVGNGLSFEPKVMGEAGFDVTVMDLSGDAMRLVEGGMATAGLPCTCVTGDLLGDSICSGPFDVVIERRTIQLFKGAERDRALAAVARRLAPRGIFVSHSHLGAWKPPAPRTHHAESWFRQNGWTVWKSAGTLRDRAAWLVVSSG